MALEYEQNIVKMKQKEVVETEMHAAIKRKQFEESENKQKEQELMDKEIQMQRLERERENLSDEYAKIEEEIKETNR